METRHSAFFDFLLENRTERELLDVQGGLGHCMDPFDDLRDRALVYGVLTDAFRAAAEQDEHPITCLSLTDIYSDSVARK